MPFHKIIKKTYNQASKEYFENKCQSFINDIVDAFRDSLAGHLGFSQEMVEGFWEPNKEIFENIFLHSGSWGIGAIQCLASKVIICYADIGDGILKTLTPFKEQILKKRPHIRYWNDATAILAAFDRNVSRFGGKSRGIGLDNLKSFIIKHQATLEYRSGKAKIIFFPNGTSKILFVENLPGVQIMISIPTSRRNYS